MTRHLPIGPQGFSEGYPSELIRRWLHLRTVTRNTVPTEDARNADAELSDAAKYLGAEVLALRDRLAQVEAEKAAMQAAVRECFAAREAVRETGDAYLRAWGLAQGPALAAMRAGTARLAKAETQLRAFAGIEAPGAGSGKALPKTTPAR